MILYCSGIEYFTRTTAVRALCFFILLTKFRAFVTFKGLAFYREMLAQNARAIMSTRNDEFLA